MDFVLILRTFGALAVVLGILVGALWLVRRYDVRLPGAGGSHSRQRRVQLIERIALDQKRYLLLVRRDDREHLLLVRPNGVLVLEHGIPVRRASQPRPQTAHDEATFRAAMAREGALPAQPLETPLPAEIGALPDREAGPVRAAEIGG